MTDVRFRLFGDGVPFTEKPAGLDSVIARMPRELYVEVEGQPTLVLTAFQRWLRRVAEQAAADVRERLHSAEFVITRDPAVIESMGAMHDCEACRAGVRAAIREVEEDKDLEMVVGVVYWAA